MKVTNLRLVVFSSVLSAVTMANTVVNQRNDLSTLRASELRLALEPKKEIAPAPREAKPEVLPMPREVKPAVAPAPREVKPAVAPAPREVTKPEVAPMPREVKPELKPATNPVPRPDIFRSTPNLFPPAPKKDGSQSSLDNHSDTAFVSAVVDEDEAEGGRPQLDLGKDIGAFLERFLGKKPEAKKVEVAPMPREVKPVAVAPMPREVKPEVKPASNPVPRPDIFRSTPNLFPPAPKKDASAEAMRSELKAKAPVAEAPAPKQAQQNAVPRPDIFRSTPNLFPNLTPRTAPVAPAVPQVQTAPMPREVKPATAKLLGDNAFTNFELIGEGKLSAEEIDGLVAGDPKLTRAAFQGRNWELLNSSVFADKLDGVYVTQREDGTVDLIVRFKNGDHFAVSRVKLTAAELGHLLKGAKEANGLGADLASIRSNYGDLKLENAKIAKIANVGEALALINQFKLSKGWAGNTNPRSGLAADTRRWADFRAGERLQASSGVSRSNTTGFNGKATHDRR